MKTRSASSLLTIGLLASLALTNLAGATMSATCITKSPVVGEPSGSAFSDADKLAGTADSSLRLYGYYECNDENGYMKYVQLILADENNSSDKNSRTLLTEIGKKDAGETCPGFTVHSPYIFRGAIDYTDGRIVGVRMQSKLGHSDLGTITKRTELEPFFDHKHLIGFYGT